MKYAPSGSGEPVAVLQLRNVLQLVVGLVKQANATAALGVLGLGLVAGKNGDITVDGERLGAAGMGQWWGWG